MFSNGQRDERMFSPAGFTMTPEIRALLSPYEWAGQHGVEPDDDDVISFEGLPAHEAEQLLRLLPPEHNRNCQNLAPSFEQFIRLGREFPEIRFHGYRVGPGRADERISIEGYYYPTRLNTERLYDRIREIAAEPDEYNRWGYADESVMRAWWD